MAAAFPLALLLPLLVLASAGVATAATTHLHLFMHDVVSGTNPTAVRVITGPGGGVSNGPGVTRFGDTMVIDDALTSTSSPTSPVLGRIQGVYMVSSQSGAVLSVTANIVLTTAEYNGSTLAVMGRDDVAADVRELAVVGGTGAFRMASGYVLWKTAEAPNPPDAVMELDVYVAVNGTDVDASAPVSPVDGGSGGSSSSGSGTGGSKSSSGTASARVSATSWVVAVGVAAVVGWCGVW